MTVMHTSQIAKSLTREKRVAIEESIRSKHCPNITYAEWLEIEKNIIMNAGKIQDTFFDLVPQAIGKAVITNQKDKDILAMLDKSFRGHLKEVDIEFLKNNLPKDQSEQTKNTIALLEDIEKMKKDLDEGK